jgi:hypothetical protein
VGNGEQRCRFNCEITFNGDLLLLLDLLKFLLYIG